MARAYAKRLNAPLAIVDKRRISTDKTEVMHILGEVAGKNVVMVDDIVATAGSLTDAAKALKNAGAKGIYAAASHGVLSGPAHERITHCQELLEVAVTNSIPLKEGTSNPKIQQLSIAPLLAEAIARTHNAQSISSLFEENRN
jgi:ribose-phosphate pyrophosphokinase